MPAQRTICLVFAFFIFPLHCQFLLKVNHDDGKKVDKEMKAINAHLKESYGSESGYVAYDETGRPYLNCDLYEPKACDPANNPACPTRKRCYVDSIHHRFGCMAVWLNLSTGAEVELKGCWTHDVAQIEACGDDECVANAESSSQASFCCCRKHNCNRNVSTAKIPNIQPRRSTLAPPINVHKRRSSSIITCIFIPMISLCVVSCLFLWLCRRKLCCPKSDDCLPFQNEKGTKDQLINGQFSLNAEPLIVQSQPLKLVVLEKLSSGRFGIVHRGFYGTKEVAVKIFPGDSADSWVQEQDIYRHPMMKNHPNLLEYLTTEDRTVEEQVQDTEEKGEKCMMKSVTQHLLVTRYMSNGSLCDYLKGCELSMSQAMLMSKSLLNGLTYLHEELFDDDGFSIKPAIVHRDLKSKNVLLKPDLTACISDFGLALCCESGRTPNDTHAQVGTRRYMAPEVLEGATEFSSFAFKQIDVYAAALVLWEILSRTVAFQGDIAPDHKLPYEAELGEKPTIYDLRDVVVKARKRPTVRPLIMQTACGQLIYQTIEQMWDVEPEGRITAGCGLDRLGTLGSKESVNFTTVMNHLNQEQKQSLIENTLITNNNLPV